MLKCPWCTLSLFSSVSSAYENWNSKKKENLRYLPNLIIRIIQIERSKFPLLSFIYDDVGEIKFWVKLYQKVMIDSNDAEFRFLYAGL